LQLPEMASIAIHPDGRQLAFQSGSHGDVGQLWVMEGLQPTRANQKDSVPRPKVIARSNNIAIRPQQLLGPNNTIKDPLHGATAVIPTGWTIKRADRVAPNVVWPNGSTGIVLSAPEKPDGPRFVYEVFDTPQPLSDQDVRAWLRNRASKIHQVRREFVSNSRERANEYVIRKVGECPALSWHADYTARDGKSEVEYGTVIRAERGHALVWFQGPATELEAIRQALDSLIASVRLP
jgi:hypothetical protein